jgi:hypothetical protein
VDKSVDETVQINANPLSVRTFHTLPQKTADRKFNEIK